MSGTTQTVFDAARAAGHTVNCATRQHMTMTDTCLTPAWCGDGRVIGAAVQQRNPSHIPTIQVAFELVQQAEAAGIAIASVSTYGDGDYGTVTILPVDDNDAPRLAEVLGLTGHRMPRPDHLIERWYGTGGPVTINTQRSVTAESLAVSA